MRGMRRVLPLLCLLLAGCSTHPGADFLDHFFPGKVRSDPRQLPYGGVCLPQGAPPGPGLPLVPSVPVPGVPVPGMPTAPLFPGDGPPAATLVPSTEPIPPPPPPPPPR